MDKVILGKTGIEVNKKWLWSAAYTENQQKRCGVSSSEGILQWNKLFRYCKSLFRQRRKDGRGF